MVSTRRTKPHALSNPIPARTASVMRSRSNAVAVGEHTGQCPFVTTRAAWASARFCCGAVALGPFLPTVGRPRLRRTAAAAGGASAPGAFDSCLDPPSRSGFFLQRFLCSETFDFGSSQNGHVLYALFAIGFSFGSRSRPPARQSPHMLPSPTKEASALSCLHFGQGFTSCHLHLFEHRRLPAGRQELEAGREAPQEGARGVDVG